MKKLTPQMQLVLRAIAEHGSITPTGGGYWKFADGVQANGKDGVLGICPNLSRTIYSLAEREALKRLRTAARDIYVLTRIE